MNRELTNGLILPQIGFGTADLEGDKVQIIKNALKCGYRLIDTAPVYDSEQAVGTAVTDLISEKQLSREDIFIETKLDPSCHGYKNTMECFEKSLDLLKTDYIDSYLIHWPVSRGNEFDYKEKNIETWNAFEELYEKGKIHSIGVCNFLERHLLQIINNCKIKPMINQLEIHPGYQQIGLVNFCRENGIFVEAWSPMGRGILKDSKFIEMSKKYNKNIAQLALRWSLQKGFVPISRSSSGEHMKTNKDIFDFEISKSDIAIIDELNSNTGHMDIWAYKRQQMY